MNCREDPAFFLLLSEGDIFYFSPHVGQSGSLRILNFLKSVVSPSHTRSCPLMFVPVPDRYFSVSRACRDPITAGVAPSTGTTSFGGASGKMQRRHGVSGDWMNESRPSMPQMLPYTRGIFFLMADSFRRYRVGKLSMQSRIMSAFLTRSSTFSATILSVKCRHRDIGVQPLERHFAGHGLVGADPRMVMEYLTVEV